MLADGALKCATVSDVQTAGAALGIPPELVRRSAAARAAADGTSVDDILAAWAGDAPPPAPAATPEPAAAEPVEQAQPEARPEAEPAPAAAAVAVLEPPTSIAEPVVDEPEVALEPVALGTRVRTAVRVGAWTGAALGVIGFLVSTAFWAPNATALPDSGPVVQISPNSVILGVALVSVLFGAIVAAVSRAATAWTNPAMELANSKSGTAWLGAVIGLVLGVIAGGMLNGFGTAVEDADPALVQLPVLPTLLVMLLGGAVLGALTALVPQLLGVPVAVDDAEEVETVKTRLGNAIGIPVAGIVLLVLLVIPFAFTLIESNHLAPGAGGAIVAVVAASGILGFSALAGSRPEMRISFGDLMVAVVGIGVVLVIIISVLFATRDEDHSGEEPAEAAVVQLI